MIRLIVEPVDPGELEMNSAYRRKMYKLAKEKDEMKNWNKIDRVADKNESDDESSDEDWFEKGRVRNPEDFFEREKQIEKFFYQIQIQNLKNNLKFELSISLEEELFRIDSIAAILAVRKQVSPTDSFPADFPFILEGQRLLNGKYNRDFSNTLQNLGITNQFHSRVRELSKEHEKTLYKKWLHRLRDFFLE